MPRALPVRGVVEGFYGTPWSHRARCDAIEFLASRGMNAYVYAPKDDEKHRARWREPYDAAGAEMLRSLAAHCTAHETRFGFAISPGLDIDYGSAADRAALLDKLLPLVDAGTDWIVLALDDIPPRDGLAVEQAELTAWLQRELRGRDAGLRLTLVPTQYVGTRPTPYLVELAAGLPPDVDLMWTGPTVCSPRISAADAEAWREATGARPLLLWDNYPVNDGVMSRSVHLGPYRGRDAALSDVVDGVLCNPMLQPHASLVALATAAEFLCDPAGYEEEKAWLRAIDAVGGARSSELAAVARACADGPLRPAEDLEIHALVADVVAELDGPGWAGPLGAVREELTALRDATRTWLDAGGADDPADALGAELAPWLIQARAEAEAGLAALRLCQQIRPVAVWRADGTGRAVAPDAENALVHAFGLVFAWDAARAGGDRVVLGPRFAVHPAVVCLDDGRQALDIGLAVHEDANAVDRLCRAALSAYEMWSGSPDAPVRVMADGAEVAVGPGGAFHADAGATLLLRAGPLATRLRGPGEPPMFDPRLA